MIESFCLEFESKNGCSRVVDQSGTSLGEVVSTTDRTGDFRRRIGGGLQRSVSNMPWLSVAVAIDP